MACAVRIGPIELRIDLGITLIGYIQTEVGEAAGGLVAWAVLTPVICQTSGDVIVQKVNRISILPEG